MARWCRIGVAQTGRRTRKDEKKEQPTRNFSAREHLKTPLRLIIDSREWYFPYFRRKTRLKIVIVCQVRFACHTHLRAPPCSAPPAVYVTAEVTRETTAAAPSRVHLRSRDYLKVSVHASTAPRITRRNRLPWSALPRQRVRIGTLVRREPVCRGIVT